MFASGCQSLLQTMLRSISIDLAATADGSCGWRIAELIGGEGTGSTRYRMAMARTLVASAGAQPTEIDFEWLSADLPLSATVPSGCPRFDSSFPPFLAEGTPETVQQIPPGLFCASAGWEATWPRRSRGAATGLTREGRRSTTSSLTRLQKALTVQSASRPRAREGDPPSARSQQAPPLAQRWAMQRIPATADRAGLSRASVQGVGAPLNHPGWPQRWPGRPSRDPGTRTDPSRRQRRSVRQAGSSPASGPP